MSEVARARILAPVLHCSLFTIVSILHWMSGQPAFKQFRRAADLFAFVLWVADYSYLHSLLPILAQLDTFSAWDRLGLGIPGCFRNHLVVFPRSFD
jgi:hypothetical protein